MADEKTNSAMTFSGTYFYANGKRKTSVARVRLYKGNGRMVVNGKDVREYFSTEDMVNTILAPLVLCKSEKNFDVSIVVEGGGMRGQAEACRHGVAKALVVADAENRGLLKPEGYLTRDSRTRERKKFGLRRARRAPQFSKR